jgi:hypothetical protein
VAADLIPIAWAWAPGEGSRRPDVGYQRGDLDLFKIRRLGVTLIGRGLPFIDRAPTIAGPVTATIHTSAGGPIVTGSNVQNCSDGPSRGLLPAPLAGFKKPWTFRYLRPFPLPSPNSYHFRAQPLPVALSTHTIQHTNT